MPNYVKALLFVTTCMVLTIVVITCLYVAVYHLVKSTNRAIDNRIQRRVTAALAHHQRIASHQPLIGYGRVPNGRRDETPARPGDRTEWSPPVGPAGYVRPTETAS